tara:strand:- start:2374 stop:3216 length:843 start_codon:yes stop_codon:yes gene_type:complete
MIKNKNLKIGIFDSGLGGLTVFKSLSLAFRNQSTFLYLGDLAHLPYGDKSKNSIIKYSEQIVNFFISKNVDMIIVACNSASSVALEFLQDKFTTPIIGTINPSVEKVLKKIDLNKSVGIIGTDTTINSKAYNQAFSNNLSIAKQKIKIHSVACPLFVPIVEEGWEDTYIAHQIATKYLSSFDGMDLDTIILACTHYPMLLETLKSVFYKLGFSHLNLIESGSAIVDYLDQKTSLIIESQNNGPLITSSDQFYITDTPHQFNNLANRFLGEPINNIQLLSL